MATSNVTHIAKADGTIVDDFGGAGGASGGTEYAEDTVSTAADKLTMAGVVRKDTAATLVDTDGDRTQLQVDANGRLHVIEASAAAAAASAASSKTDLDTIASAIKIEDAAHASGDPGIMPLAVRNDGASTALTNTNGDYSPMAVDSSGRQLVAGQATHDAAVSGSPVIIGAVASAAAPSAVSTDQDAVRLWASLQGQLAVFQSAHIAGGASSYKSLDLDETEEEIKATPATLYGFHFVNRTTAIRYLKFYNDTAANVVVGTTVPVLTFELPANASDHVSGWVGLGVGFAFSAALTFAVTTGFADNDSGAPGTNDVMVNVAYK